MLTVLAFIVTIGIIVTIHEYGHFQVARWCGVKILRFSIGFGKPLFRQTFGKDKTEFVLASIPLGGYVKMLDENEIKAEKEADSDTIHPNYSEAELTRAFNRQSVYKRISIVLAGPVANLLLAILIYWFLIMQGVTGMRPIIGAVSEGSVAAKANLVPGSVIQSVNGKKVNTWSEASWALLNASLEDKTVALKTLNNQNELHTQQLTLAGLSQGAEMGILQEIGVDVFRPKVKPLIDRVLSDGAAAKAGLLPGDEVISINEMQTDTWNKAVDIIKESPNIALSFSVKRNAEILDIVVTPESVNENKVVIGKIGAVAKVDQAQVDALMIKQHYSLFKSLELAVSKTWKMSAFSLKMMWYMITGKTSWKGISGPVTIASYAGQSAGLGFAPFLSFIALVSISIGILNLLPIPVLDGGHLMYYMAEIIKGSAVTEQTLLIGQKVGFGLLGLLMTLAIFNDINRIVAG